jgi:hyperosmotically inducible protein
MRRLTTLTFAVTLAAASIGCQSATNTNVATNKPANANSNVAVVVPNNSNMAANTGSVTSNSTSSTNYNVSRADYDKDRAKYEAEKGTSTIGTGANDSWIWFKTKGALAGVNDLRDSTINVDVDNGVITLKGSVGSAAQKTAAETAAKGIEGQKGIKNQLTVNANDSMTNQMTSGNSNAKTTNSNANMKK